MGNDQNQDDQVISHFSGEWRAFNYLNPEQLEEVRQQFYAYVRPLPDKFLDRTDLDIGDFGAGSGRWAHFLLESARELWLVEPGLESFELLHERFANNKKVQLLNETVSDNAVPPESLDLAVSLGVLHHIPDTLRGVQDIYRKMKPGGYFLCYLYYALENKPVAYRLIWKLSNQIRLSISKLPFAARRIVCEVIAAVVYFPVARLSKLFSKVGLSTSNIPLHHYQDMTYYVMRNDAFDRFGTSLEQRFTKGQIVDMLEKSGFEMSSLVFSETEPFWTFVVMKPILKTGV